MEKTIVTTGKTIELAVEEALTRLGLDRDSVSVTVLAQAKSGFLGFGAQPAKVQVTYEVPAEALRKGVSQPPKAEKAPEAPKAEAPKPAPKAPEAPKPAAEKRCDAPKAPRAPREPREPKPPQTPKAPKTYAPAAPGSVEETIEQFLTGLLKHMGSEAVPHAWKDEEGAYQVDLVGDDLGYLIGRRGDTLDAIQHLCNYAVNRGVEGHVRVHVDAEEYRVKREESLRRYARKKAQQVLKARRRTTLEPMNAYERHVIHATLQDMENITTHSTGTEPNRRVVIEYVR